MIEQFFPYETKDFSPMTLKEKLFYEKLDKQYDYMYDLHGEAKLVMRYKDTPYMAQEEGKRIGESLPDHYYALVHFWLSLYPSLPHVSNRIDHKKVYEYMTLHDDGERKDGDISAYLQLNGHGIDREEKETVAFFQQTSVLPDESQQHLNKIFSEYSHCKKDPLTTNKEALLVKMFDTMESDCNVLAFSQNWSAYQDSHKRIVESKFVPYALRLQSLFLAENDPAASEEIKILTNHHLHQYQKRGLNIRLHDVR